MSIFTKISRDCPSRLIFRDLKDNPTLRFARRRDFLSFAARVSAKQIIARRNSIFPLMRMGSQIGCGYRKSAVLLAAVIILESKSGFAFAKAAEQG